MLQIINTQQREQLYPLKENLLLAREGESFVMSQVNTISSIHLKPGNGFMILFLGDACNTSWLNLDIKVKR